MKIYSNKQLLNLISNHEVGIKYPELIPRIMFNILIQQNISILDPNYYPSFKSWFYWPDSLEGYTYWATVNATLKVVN